MLRSLSAIVVTLFVGLCVSAHADEPDAARPRRIDKQRQKVLRQIEELRRDPSLDRMNYSIRLSELHRDLFTLDYDDPRTRLGAAVAMSDVSDDELIDLLFDLVLARKPTDEQVQICRQHLAELKGRRREAVLDLVWAMCNTKEFVERIDR